MNLIKIGIASTNPTVGAFRTNTDNLIGWARLMSHSEATLGIFGEMAIGGYPPEDLVNWKDFVTGQLAELRRFAAATVRSNGFPTRTIYKVGLAVMWNEQVYNCVATVWNGKICGLVPKEDNPTYNVFYELRKFAKGHPGLVGEVDGILFGDIMYRGNFGMFSSGVCESVWQADGPMVRRAYYGSVLDAYVNASPWRVGVRNTRKEMLATRSSDNLIIVPYANLVGAQDSLVFDGGGHVYSLGHSLLDLKMDDLWKEGCHYAIADVDEISAARTNNTTWRLRAEKFMQDNKPAYTLVDVPGPDLTNELHYAPAYARTLPKSFFIPDALQNTYPNAELMNDLERAMVTGIAGYMEKTKRPDGTPVFKRIGIANSGGRDSILVLCLAHLYAEQRSSQNIEDVFDLIHCFSFPTQFNSEDTKSLSRISSEVLGATFHEVPITTGVAELRELLIQMHTEDDASITSIAGQNLQSRIRAILMMTWGNSTNALILQTGVMSEEATGYSTMLGDHNCGFLAPIKNLPKTLVNELLQHFRIKYDWAFIDDLLKSTASAELEEDQEDERDLMPYPILDDCIHLFAGKWLMPHELYEVLRYKWSEEQLLKIAPHYTPGMLKVWVRKFVTRFFGNIFKWVQAPLGIHLGNLDLDRERALQLPVVQSLEWLEKSFELLDKA